MYALSCFANSSYEYKDAMREQDCAADATDATRAGVACSAVQYLSEMVTDAGKYPELPLPAVTTTVLGTSYIDRLWHLPTASLSAKFRLHSNR